MFLTIPDTLVQDAISDGVRGGNLYGRLLDDGDVVQVWGLDEVAGSHLGGWVRADQAPPIDTLRPGLLPDGEVLLLIRPGPTPSVEAYRYQAQQPHPLP